MSKRPLRESIEASAYLIASDLIPSFGSLGLTLSSLVFLMVV